MTLTFARAENAVLWRRAQVSRCQPIAEIHRMQQRSESGPEPSLVKAVWLVAIMGAGAVLYIAQDVLIPVAMAIFLALLLAPAVDRLQGLGMRRGFAAGQAGTAVVGVAGLGEKVVRACESAAGIAG